MTLRFDSTKRFEKELDKFSSKERNVIIEKFNRLCEFIESDPNEFYKHAHQPVKLKLVDDESTLYALKINRKIRIIMAIDEDPLFDQTIITLFHVVRHSELDKKFKSIAESLYQKQLSSTLKVNNG